MVVVADVGTVNNNNKTWHLHMCVIYNNNKRGGGGGGGGEID